jgi:hypothetical protein
MTERNVRKGFVILANSDNKANVKAEAIKFNGVTMNTQIVVVPNFGHT